MKWIKKGHIFKPEGNLFWSLSHAQIPRPLILEDRIRIYYATRFLDESTLPISNTSFIDVDKDDLTKILYIHDKPVLENGVNDTFSAHGIHPSMLISKGDEILLFYQGWRRNNEAGFETALGLAVSRDMGLTFEKQGISPLFGKSNEDPFFVNGLFILENLDSYYTWYSSGIKWINIEGRNESIYIIKQAVTSDLINWERSIVGSIKPKLENECQNSATVIHFNNQYHMWFSYRYGTDFRNTQRGYRIGYAWSIDLLNWNRDDSIAPIDISREMQWDSQMICYPYVFKINKRILMLYCGNYFGKEGFGYAELII